MNKNRERTQQPSKQEQEEGQSPDTQKLAEEVSRLWELAVGFNVPVVLETRDETRDIWPDFSIKVYRKKRRNGSSRH